MTIPLTAASAWRLLREEGVDAFLITNAVNVTYLTGFSGDSSALILGRERTLLVSDPRYTQQIAEECGGLATHIRPPAQKLYDAVAEVLLKLGHRHVGFESAGLHVADLDAIRAAASSLNWKGDSERVERLRRVTDEWEIGQIREAITIA